MELNVDKIEKELKRRGKNRSWLARKIVVDRSTVHYWMNTKTIVGVEKIAEVLEYEPKDLIK